MIKILILGAGECGKVRRAARTAHCRHTTLRRFFPFAAALARARRAAQRGGRQSTILKQIKIIHGVPFSKEDREAVREALRQNTVTAIHTLLDAVAKLKVKVDSKSSALVRKLADYPPSEPVRLRLRLRARARLTARRPPCRSSTPTVRS